MPPRPELPFIVANWLRVDVAAVLGEARQLGLELAARTDNQIDAPRVEGTPDPETTDDA